MCREGTAVNVSDAIGVKLLEPDPTEITLAEESAGDLLESTIFRGVALTQPSDAVGESREEQRRLRRLFATTRSLLQVAEEEGEDERDVVMTVVQAAAIWHDVDARAYRRDLQGRFVLDAWLPGADLTVGPRDFSAFSVVSGPVVRISSTAEQEQLGWHNLSGELALLPIAAGSQGQPRWILAILLQTDAIVPSNLLMLCEVLGLCLDRMAAQRGQEVRKRLIRDLVEREDTVAQLANATLLQVVSVLGARQGRLLMGIGGETALRTMAATSGEWTAGPTAGLEPGRSVMTPSRLTVAFSVGARAVAMLDLTPREEAEFTISHAMLLEAAVSVIKPWLAGVLDGTVTPALEPEPSSGFELRIAEELARTKRFHLETGLLVIDVPVAQRPSAQTLAAMPIPDVVVRQLRSSDMVGRLEGGEICALLVHTNADGVASAERRLRRSFEALAQPLGLPRMTLGTTPLTMGDESVADVLARAKGDAKQRSGEQE